MRWIIPAGVLGASAGLAGLALLFRSRASGGGKSILYVQQGVREDPEFRRGARTLSLLVGVPPVFVRSPQELVRHIRDQRGVGRIIIHGHGSPWGVMIGSGNRGVRTTGRDREPTMRVETFARAIAPTLKRGFVIGLNACSSGSNPRQNAWGAQAYSSSGERSFAALLRDALVRAGAPRGEIRANSAMGTHGNPSGRTFVVDREHVGRPGRSLLEETWGEGRWRDSATTRRWASVVGGGPAYRWITGHPLEIPAGS